MKSDYRVRASRFIHSVFSYIENYLTEPCMVEEAIDNYNRDHSRKVEVMYGSARIALITSDYVVKWDYDEDCVDDIGGCLDEYEAYMKAKQDGFDYLLAETTLIEVNNITFSIMPRIRNVGPTHHKGDISNYLNPVEWGWVQNFDRDLHHYNWGIRHGKACIIDYALTEEVVERSSW